jgi:hypothetical protein
MAALASRFFIVVPQGRTSGLEMLLVPGVLLFKFFHRCDSFAAFSDAVKVTCNARYWRCAINTRPVRRDLFFGLAANGRVAVLRPIRECHSQHVFGGRFHDLLRKIHTPAFRRHFKVTGNCVIE